MKKMILVLVCLLPLASFANNSCETNAIDVVAKIAQTAPSNLSIIGSIKKDLAFYAFVADTYEESLVYEVKLNAGCDVVGFYETSIYTDEIEAYSFEEISVFLNAKY